MSCMSLTLSSFRYAVITLVAIVVMTVAGVTRTTTPPPTPHSHRLNDQRRRSAGTFNQTALLCVLQSMNIADQPR